MASTQPQLVHCFKRNSLRYNLLIKYLMRGSSWNEHRITEALTDRPAFHSIFPFQSLSNFMIQVKTLQKRQK